MRYIGVYEVIGNLPFRTHKQGTVFMASIPASIERRRIEAGHIRLVERVGADLPRKYHLPEGWM